MLYTGFLEMAESEDAASEDRPQLLLLELAVALLTLDDLIVEGLMRVLVQSVQLVKIGAEVVFGGLEVLWVRDGLHSRAATCCSPLRAFFLSSVRLRVLLNTYLSLKGVSLRRHCWPVSFSYSRDTFLVLSY